MRAVLFALALGAMAGYGPAALADGPPLTDGWYLDEGACPFEGCVYRVWTVAAETVLYDAPWSTRPVGTARIGDAVEGLTGIVYTKPLAVEVAHEVQIDAVERGSGVARFDLHRGQTILLLTYQGEGYFLAWLDGGYLSVDATEFLPRTGGPIFRSCDVPSPRCWWRIAADAQPRKSVWWAQIRLPDGTTGWTREVANFGNKDMLG